MIGQILSCLFGVVLVVGFCVMTYGASLIVGDKERAWAARRHEELVSNGGKADGDDTGREGKEEDS
jgi:hypothetical protein